MKISFKGKVNLQGRLKVRKDRKVCKVRKKAKIVKPQSKTPLQSVRRAVRLEVNRGLAQLQRNMEALRIGIRRDMRKELYSQRFSRMIRDAVTGQNELRDLANQYLNKDVVVTTSAGPVAGRLIRVGTNFLVLQETDSTIVIVPFSSTASIRPQ